MTRALWVTGITITAMTLTVSGTAAASPLAPADVSRSIATSTGWYLEATLSSMSIDAVPNMGAIPLTREGFVTGHAAAQIGGDGPVPVNTGTVEMGVQVGCQVDLSDGGSVGAGGLAALDPSLLSRELFDAGPYAAVDGNLSINIRPGKITELVLGTKEFTGRTGQVFMRDAHVDVSGCAGRATIRLFATATINTDTSIDSINVFGAIVTL